MMKSVSKFQLPLVCVQERKECHHMRSAFCFDNKAMGSNLLAFYVKIKCHASLNSQCTCFGSTLLC